MKRKFTRNEDESAKENVNEKKSHEKENNKLCACIKIPESHQLLIDLAV